MKVMGSEQIFKKSMLGGFKKEGVLNYVEQLQSEIIELKKEISNKPDLSDEVEALKAVNEDVAAESAALAAKYDALKAENEALSEKNSELMQDLDEAKKLICDYEEKQSLFENKLSAIESKFDKLASGYMTNGNTDADCSSKAGAAVKTAKIEISDANERIKNACDDFESSSSALKSSVENLLNILSGISEEFCSADNKEE